jgi:hypothetical protein
MEGYSLILELIFKNTKYIEIETDIITTEIRDNIAYVILVEKLLQISSGRSVQGSVNGDEYL